MNYALRQIVAEGVDPMTAVQMATINVARAHRSTTGWEPSLPAMKRIWCW